MLIIKMSYVLWQDTFRHGMTVALAMVALSFSLPVPSDLVIYGNICSGALIISADRVSPCMVRAYCRTAVTAALLPRLTDRYATRSPRSRC